MNDKLLFDTWLTHYYDEYLTAKNELCKNNTIPLSEIFKDLDDIDLWVMILSKRFRSYPDLKKRLPGFPDADIQKKYNGGAGFEILKRGRVSYEKITKIYNKYRGDIKNDTNILDFGVGWGRIIRYFLKDLPNTNLFGCDVSEFILNESKRIGLNIQLQKSDPIPLELPFQEKFDLVYSNSVFSHLSEEALNACFAAINKSMKKGGLFIFTTWGPNYAMNSKKMTQLGLKQHWNDKSEMFEFIPQKEGLSFGATFISYPYMKKQWTNNNFTFREVQVQTFGFNQVMCVLQKK